MSLTGHVSNGGVTTLCYCWVVVRSDGVSLGVTDHDYDVVVEGVTCSSTTGMVTTKVTRSLGLEADDMTVEGAIDDEEITEEDLENGLYDNADVTVYLVNWRDASEYQIIAQGSFGNVVKQDGGTFSVDFRSLLTVLSQSEGRTYQRRCDANLGDTRCGVDVSDPLFSTTTTIVTIEDGTITVASTSGYEEGWFSNGTVRFEDGSEHRVRTHAGTVLTLWAPPLVTPAVASSVEIVVGCDKRHQTCAQRFDNILNFRGFHLMPGEDRVTSYPLASESGNYDGESLFET